MPHKFTEGRHLKADTGDELAWIRCRAGTAGKPDGVVHRGSRGGMARAATRERGGQPIYSAIAIETLVLRLVFHQPLRQTEGLLRSTATCSGSILPSLIIRPSAVAVVA